jgi:mono/diheme cytochrome c family protein
LKNLRNLQPGAKRVIKDVPVTEVTFGIGDTGKKTATLYIDQKLGIARGISLKNDADGTPSDLLVVATDIKLGTEPLPTSQFAFTAPAGAKKFEKPAEAPATYASVADIFARNCNGCHGGGNPKGGLNTTSYQTLMAGSRSGPVITPGDPDNSIVLQYIKGIRQPRMPKNMAPLPDAEVQTITKWIAGGAKEN